MSHIFSNDPYTTEKKVNFQYLLSALESPKISGLKLLQVYVQRGRD